MIEFNVTIDAINGTSSMDIVLSTMTKWVKQLREERQGETPKASPITPEKIEIRELKKKFQRIEMENEILKKTTVDSIGQRNSHVKHGVADDCWMRQTFTAKEKASVFELVKELNRIQ